MEGSKVLPITEGTFNITVKCTSASLRLVNATASYLSDEFEIIFRSTWRRLDWENLDEKQLEYA